MFIFACQATISYTLALYINKTTQRSSISKPHITKLSKMKTWTLLLGLLAHHSIALPSTTPNNNILESDSPDLSPRAKFDAQQEPTKVLLGRQGVAVGIVPDPKPTPKAVAPPCEQCEMKCHKAHGSSRGPPVPVPLCRCLRICEKSLKCSITWQGC